MLLFFYSNCSGAINLGVPPFELLGCIKSIGLDSPKSASFAYPSEFSRIFSSFISLCTIEGLVVCKNASAFAIS